MDRLFGVVIPGIVARQVGATDASTDGRHPAGLFRTPEGVRRPAVAVGIGALVASDGARGAVLAALGELSGGAELCTTLAVAITGGEAPLLVAVGNLSGDVAFGVIGHEATRVGVAVIGLTGIGNVISSHGEVRIALLHLLLVAVDGTEATTGLLVPDAGGTKRTTEEIKDLAAALAVGAGLVAHHLGVTGQRTDLDGKAVAEGEAVIKTIDKQLVISQEINIKAAGPK